MTVHTQVNAQKESFQFPAPGFQRKDLKLDTFPMRFIGNIIEKMQRHPKRVVFPEGTEPRILQAARQFYALRLGVPILLGDQAEVKAAAAKLDVPLDGVRIINPATSEDLD